MSTKSVNAAAGAYREPVLVVEDTKENQDLLKGIFKKLEIPCEIAENGAVAMEMLGKKAYSLYVVDLMMPVMDGRAFITALKLKEPDAVILVQTALDSSDTIISVMKMGIFDYVIKPIDPELFRETLYKALDYAYLKKEEKQQSLNAGLKIRNQIEWLSYKDSMRLSGKGTADNKSIYNIKTSLAQGAGFGSLTTLIDMMKSVMEDNGDKYLIDKQIIDLITENNEYCRLQMEGLHSAADIMEMDITLEECDAASIVAAIPEILTSIMPHLSDKNLTLTFPELKDNCKISCNRDKLGLVFEEMVVNAYKYALPGTAINIFTHISEGYFWLSVKNDIREKPYGGVPDKFEKLVLEPFFRIQPPDESAAKFERLGFGLGLAVADYVLKKHNGLFIIHDVKDLTHERERMCVLAEMLLPVKK